jgi:hypothetical protein
MGFNPFKAVKKAVKGVTKPFKKILKSPIGKAAALAGLGYLGYRGMGPGTNFGKWFGALGPLKQAGIVGLGTTGLSLAGQGFEEDEEEVIVDDTSGQENYLAARKFFPFGGYDPLWKGNQGGRVEANIGLYAGQGGGMNNSMNPMMNQGLGATGAQGMNPYNQQNLMAQGQMRGQPPGGMPQGRPAMAQGPGIPSARPATLPKERPNTDLIELIKLLVSLGIPMEQLRGRTEEELVEMAIAVKERVQPEGREEVVEESEEVIGTEQPEDIQQMAAQGGRIGFDGGGVGTQEDFNKFLNEHKEFNLQYNLDKLMENYKHWYKQQSGPEVVEAAQGGRIGYDDGGLGFKTNNTLNQKSLDLFGVLFNFLNDKQKKIVTQRVGNAQGGRIHASNGYPNPEEEYIDVSGEAGTRYLRENHPGMLAEIYSDEEEEVVIPKADGGLMRTGYAMGSEQPVIPSKDGPQIDYRDMGGYQPHGKAEKHDDVRALLAQGEFVVTSDAVKGIGEGDRDLGAKRMYDMMHKYEPIGRALS